MMRYSLKQFLCIALALLLVVSMTACGQKETGSQAQTEQTPAQSGTQPEAQPQTEPASENEPPQEEPDAGDSMPDVFDVPVGEGSVYVKDGLKLAVPDQYANLVLVGQGSPLFGSDNLFSVREIASMEAGQKTHPGEDWGEGALFGIGRLTEDEAHEMMCGYFNNEHIFARDADRNYYVIFRPTDVRFYRENMEENMEALVDSPDMQMWGELNEWAAGIPEQFIELNGLEAWSFGGSTAETLLSHIAYRTDTLFVLNSLDYGELYPADPEPSASFAAQLVENVDFEYCDDSVEAPDGEYFVIEFPNDMMSIDVFKGGDYIREEYDGFQMLLKVTGPTEGYFVDVMNQWNQALQKAGS